MNEKNIVPVLLGADLNCYSVARAFHEAYGVISYAFGRYKLGMTSHSSIVKFTEIKNLGDDSVMVSELVSFAEKHKEDELYLFGCTDEYAEMIIRNRVELSKYYFCPCIDAKTASRLITKEYFYGICGKFGIPFPKTHIFYPESDYTSLYGNKMGFGFPIIIKPSHSSIYWKHPFPGMKKVYTANTPDEAKAIITKIFDSGYNDSVVVQDMIPGDDTKMFVLTSYSGTDGKVKRMCMGHVLLEEHTPKGIGNHTAVITENHPEIVDILRGFLDAIGYIGFSNFDIKYDSRDNTFKVFEINLRQGRSNYYVTAAGQNIAETVVRDRHGELPAEAEICDKRIFWYTVPKPVIYKYVNDSALAKKLQMIVRSGNSASTLWYGPDLKNPLRRFFVSIHNVRYYGKYKKYQAR